MLIRCVLLQKVTLYFGTNQQNKSLSQELFKWFLATAPACAINLTNLGHHHWLKLPKNVATNSEEAMWLHLCAPCHTNSSGGFRTLLPTAWRITIPWFIIFFYLFIYYKIRITFSQEGRQSLIAFAFQCLACQHELSLWGPPMLPRTVAVATGEGALRESVCPASIRNRGEVSSAVREGEKPKGQSDHWFQFRLSAC